MTDQTDRDILDFIADFYRANEYPPSMTDIGGHVGLAKSTIKERLHKLEDAGVIRRVVKGQRTLKIEIVEDAL